MAGPPKFAPILQYSSTGDTESIDLPMRPAQFRCRSGWPGTSVFVIFMNSSSAAMASSPLAHVVDKNSNISITNMNRYEKISITVVEIVSRAMIILLAQGPARALKHCNRPDACEADWLPKMNSRVLLAPRNPTHRAMMLTTKQAMNETKRPDEYILMAPEVLLPIASRASFTLCLPLFKNAKPTRHPMKEIALPHGKASNKSLHSSQHTIAFSRDRWALIRILSTARQHNAPAWLSTVMKHPTQSILPVVPISPAFPQYSLTSKALVFDEPGRA
mmetsp:Transcript_7086/g.11432  ORF Transcript_7086/g.11432 Transcript_7086/m.11432 type:complete len:275 (-) Transcript_7086:527-1351(-)